MEAQYTEAQLKTIRDYLEGMLVTVTNTYETQKRIIEGKLRWLNSLDEPQLFLVDSAGVVTIQDHRTP